MFFLTKHNTYIRKKPLVLRIFNKRRLILFNKAAFFVKNCCFWHRKGAFWQEGAQMMPEERFFYRPANDGLRQIETAENVNDISRHFA